MYFWNFGDFQVVGASPEILVRQERIVDNGVPKSQITIRPLAGTRKRGATPEEDAALAAELKADPKEVAEHVMLIDLARNDVGRVAEVGSVKVSDTMVIERYSHVMHLVSNVTGTLNPGMSSMDVLRASFPAGTLTGAPKVEAMKLIDELEPVRRGIYGGAAGYLSYGGEMDVAIAIRTGVIRTARCMCRPPPASSPTPIRKPNGPRPKPRPAPCCARPSRCSTAWTNPSERAPTTDTTSGAGPGSPGEEHAADDRQLRFVYLQPGAVLRRTGRGRARRAQRPDHAGGDRRAQPRPHLRVARPPRRPRLASRCP